MNQYTNVDVLKKIKDLKLQNLIDDNQFNLLIQACSNSNESNKIFDISYTEFIDGYCESLIAKSRHI